MDLRNPPEGDRYGIKTAIPWLKSGHLEIFWCDGNHENHDALDALEQQYPDMDFIPVMPHVHFARFGSTLTLIDGTTVMFCGGGASHDKDERIPGTEWWPQEVIDEVDMRRLPEGMHVDWIVSHVKPPAFDLPGCGHGMIDSSVGFLEDIRLMYRPSRCFFGHYHKHGSGYIDGCRWQCPDYPRHRGPWYDGMLLTEAGEDWHGAKF